MGLCVASAVLIGPSGSFPTFTVDNLKDLTPDVLTLLTIMHVAADSFLFKTRQCAWLCLLLLLSLRQLF